MLFTTSWDDGHPLDLRVAEVLDKYGMKGTFYVCRDGQMGGRLSEGEIKDLSKRHEIGAHTLTHPSLPTLSATLMREEIEGGKKWVEDVLTAECKIFAYPYGHYDERAVFAVKEAKFIGARTTEDLEWKIDPFTLSPTVQVRHFPIRRIPNRRFLQPFTSTWRQLHENRISIIDCRSWLSMAKAAFRSSVMHDRPWFHLWGHSWTLERDKLWGVFEEMLRFVKEQPKVKFVENSALIR